MNLLDQLNPEQREAVLNTDGPLLIVAGAGSGKTRVIVHRIAHILESGKARPDEVLAVTFTNKAAEEMRLRVESLVGDGCEAIWLSTFHALCARLLRREAPHIGLSRDFVIYDTVDQLAAIKQVMRALKVDDGVLQPRAVLSRISHAKNRMEPPATAFGQSFHPGIEDLRRIFAGYVRALDEAKALDFDDLLLKTVQLFEKPDVAARYGSRFRFVMVDEYQDTNRPQYLLIRKLAAVHHNICVVGDPDQSIYKWRGADLRNILDFEKDFPNARVIRLERNYRSTQVILAAASAVIDHNVERKPKRLWTDRAGGGKIVYFRGGDELEEADFISRTIRRLLREDTEASAAVLYRTNAQSRVIEDAFRREGIPYRIVGGVRFYERKEIKDALAYMKLILNPHDDVSLRRVINVPARGVGKGVMDALEQVPLDQGLLAGAADAPEPASLWTRLRRGLDDRRFTPRAAASLAAFRDLIVQVTEMAGRETLAIAIGKVLDQSGYLEDLRAERTEEAQGRVENLAELVSAAREFEARETAPTLAGFVDRLSLLSDVDEEEGSRDARALMMTLHSAKGLEFPAVIMAGLEEGLFPHALASEDADIEEERRLCYVGMTRARALLFLTGAARRRVFGEYRAAEPSRFIDEVPSELVDATELAAASRWDRSLPFHERRVPFRGPRGPQVREEGPRYVYDDEAHVTPPLGPGLRVRHPTFGVGTVLSVEELDDDVKVTVRFVDIGQKKLLAKYAKLERA
jgi:DNA helicase-2/ATP-dependent DNA helicase PcrA